QPCSWRSSVASRIVRANTASDNGKLTPPKKRSRPRKLQVEAPSAPEIVDGLHEGAPEVPAPSLPDPFDLASARLAEKDMDDLTITPGVTTIPIKKPAKDWFIRTHPSEDYRLRGYVIELDDKEMFYVHHSLWPALKDMESTFRPKLLMTAVNS